MSGATRILCLLSLLGGAAGALLEGFAAGSVAGFGTVLARSFQLDFASGPWRLLLTVAVGSAAVALGLSLVEGVLVHGKARGRRRYPAIDQRSIRDALAEMRRRVEECADETPPNAIVCVDELLAGAAAIGASDIHLSPIDGACRIQVRVHGVLYEVATLELKLLDYLTMRVKVLARLNTFLRNKPQDGRLVMSLERGTLEARVSILPTESGGDRVVLRLVRGASGVPELLRLGLSGPLLRDLERLLSRPQGLILLTGPAGSGKTTTLYSCLQHIATTRGRTTSLVTLEDPVELKLPFATQTQIDPASGMTFATTLRSVLRQDPNVLMVGEIRDRETAEIALSAGLSGHLILSTVHAQNAAGPFVRLVELGVDPSALSSAVIGCLSQRLVRALCTACCREATASSEEIARFAEAEVVLPDGPYFVATGCEHCDNEGYIGRLPIGEILLVDAELQKEVERGASAPELYRKALARGMTTLLSAGVVRARAGETSLSEVLRVAG